MQDLARMLALQAPMRVTKIVQPHREPTHPIEGTHGDPLDPALLRVFFHLPIGPALRLAEDRARSPALRLALGDRVTPSTGLQEG